MLRGLLGASLRFRYLLLLVAVALGVVGGLQLHGQPVDLLPEFSLQRVEIQTEALGLAAAEVEALITVPLEEMLSGVAWVQSMDSKSINGLSSIVLVFEPGTDIMKARQMVQERLLQASALPKVSKRPVMRQPVSWTNRIMTIGLTSKERSLIEVSVLARWNIRPRLMGVPGVANVAIWGQRDRQLQVQVDPQRLKERGVRLDDVIKATGDALWTSPLTFLQSSTPGNGGFIDTPNQRLEIRHVLPISSPEDLSRVTFAAADGTVIRLGDVAQVVEGHQPLIGDGIVNDGPGLLLVVERFPWADTLEVTKGVEAALTALQPGLSGVSVDPTIFRPASFIEWSLRDLTGTLAIGGVVVALVLLASFYSWREALVSLVAIPLSLMAAALALCWSGATINMLILAGLAIALGEVVADAVVDVENVTRRLRENRSTGNPRPAAAVILDAALEIRSAVIYATLIVVLAISPVFLMGGQSAAFLRPLATAYLLALLASMVVALTITPALSLILLRGPLPGRGESPLLGGLRWIYEAILPRVLASPRMVFAATGAMVLLGLVLLPLLGHSLAPSFKERDLLMRWVTAPGTSYPEMSRLAMKASGELRAIPGVRDVGAHLGRAVMSDQVVDVNAAEFWISVDPKANYDATLAAIRKVAGGYPGLSLDPQSFSTMRLDDELTSADNDVVVRVYGPDLGILREKAEQVRQALSGIAGIVAPRVDAQVAAPEVQIEVDLAKAAGHGIKPGDVRRAATTLLAGIEVGGLFEDQKVFEVVVWGVPETRRDPATIRELLIDTPEGGHVRLGDVADVRLASDNEVHDRADASRRIDVRATVTGRDVGAVAGDVERRLQKIGFPLQYHAELLGDYDERQSGQLHLLGFLIAAAIGIFLMLQAACGSWRLAAVSFVALPSALAGGVLAALIDDGVISLGSLAGFLTLLGIAARNGILTIKHYQHLERSEGEAFGPALILRGARERLRPILITALSTGLAVLPFVVVGSVPGLEILHPMAVVVFGGLVTATALGVFVIPVLYAAFPARSVEAEIGRLSHAAP